MSKDKMKASWDTNTTKIFIDLCLEQVKRGTRKGSSSQRIGWPEIIKNFAAKTGRIYDKTQLKNKYDSLRKEWQSWERLIRETGIGWDNERNTVSASDEWWEKKILEVKDYEKFRARGLQFHEELTRLFSNVAATGASQWAPSSMTLPTNETVQPDTNEGSGDSDEVHVTTTGVSRDFDSFTVNEISGGSGGNTSKGKGTTGGERSSSGYKTTSSLGVRKKGDTMKKKGPSSAKIADALSLLVEEARADRVALEARANKFEEEARADRMLAEARAYEISIAGVMEHLSTVTEIVSDNDFFARCVSLLTNHPPAREMYAAFKHMREKLVVCLKHECYKDNK